MFNLRLRRIGIGTGIESESGESAARNGRKAEREGERGVVGERERGRRREKKGGRGGGRRRRERVSGEKVEAMAVDCVKARS